MTTRLSNEAERPDARRDSVGGAQSADRRKPGLGFVGRIRAFFGRAKKKRKTNDRNNYPLF